MVLAKFISISLLFPTPTHINSLSLCKTHPHLQFPFPSFPFLHHQHHTSCRSHKPQIPRCQNSNNNNNTTQQTDTFSDTHRAISQFLQDTGLASHDADSIASNCPNYTKMLIDNVRDLEEWNSFASGSGSGSGSGGNGFGQLGFKEKVIYMAKDKGDFGKVAFFESLGLSLSSAMNVARYLSRESLLVLFHKVKYMKEMLFYDRDDNGIIAKNAHRMMMHLSIPVNEELQRTLSLFEKIEARRGGLDSLNSLDASFRYLIESFPLILSLPVDSHFEPLVEFLETIGVSREHMRSILLLFPPMIFYGVKGIKRKVFALEKAGAVGKDCGRMLLKYPWILSAEIQDNYSEILPFFEMEMVDKVSVEKGVRKWPLLLGCSTAKLKVMVDQFSEIGVRNKKLGHVIAKSPQLLLKKPHEFLQVVSYFETLGFDKESIGKVLARSPEVFATSVQKTLKKKVKFLKAIGVSEDYFPRVIKKYPELLVSNIDETMLPRLKFLRDIGLSKKEIAFMVRRFSPLLGYSIDQVLRPKYDFLVNTMQKPVKDVVEYPRYFSYSLEKKIKPRFWVLKGMNVECSLKDMLDKNDDEFAADFMDARGLLASGSSPDG